MMNIGLRIADRKFGNVEPGINILCIRGLTARPLAVERRVEELG